MGHSLRYPGHLGTLGNQAITCSQRRAAGRVQPLR